RSGRGHAALAVVGLLLHVWVSAALPLSHFVSDSHRASNPEQAAIELLASASVAEPRAESDRVAHEPPSVSRSPATQQHAVGCVLCRALETPLTLEPAASETQAPPPEQSRLARFVHDAPSGALLAALPRGPPAING